MTSSLKITKAGDRCLPGHAVIEKNGVLTGVL